MSASRRARNRGYFPGAVLVLLAAVFPSLHSTLEAGRPDIVWMNAGNNGQGKHVAFSSREDLAASCGSESSIKLWRPSDGSLVRTFSGHTGGTVNSVAFSPDGQLLASGGEDDSLKLWRVADGALIGSIEETPGNYVLTVAFSPDGQLVATGNTDFKARLRPVSDPTLVKELVGHTSYVGSVSFSPDGATAATASNDGTVKLWTVPEGEEIRTLTGHTGAVLAVAFSPDGQTLASGGEDRTLRLWRAADGASLDSIPTIPLTSIAFSPRGGLVAAAGPAGIGLWGTDGSDGGKLSDPGPNDEFSAVAFSPDGGTLLSIGGASYLKLWDISTLRKIRTFNGEFRGPLASLAFNGQTVAVPARDRWFGDPFASIRLWRSSDGSLNRTIAGEGDHSYTRTVAFSPDGLVLASGDRDGATTLWNASAGEVLHTLPGTGEVYSVAFSPAGGLLATGARDGTRLWNRADGSFNRLVGPGARSVAFSTTGEFLALGAGPLEAVQQIHIVHVPDGAPVKDLQIDDTGPTSSTVFLPDGETLAAGYSDGNVRLWNMSDWSLLKELPGHTAAVWTVAASPDGKLLLSGGADGTLRIWDLQTWELLRTYDQETGPEVVSAAFSPDGQLIAYARIDAVVVIAFNPLTEKAILPSSGCNSGRVSVRILTEPIPDPTAAVEVRLKAAGATDIIGEDTTVVSDRVISTRFELQGFAPGTRDVVITPAPGDVRIFPGGFTVDGAGGPHLWTEALGNRRVLRGRPYFFRVLFGNSGCTDAGGSFIWVSIRPPPEEIHLGFTYTRPPLPTDGSPPIPWEEDFPMPIEMPDRTIVPFFVPFLPPEGIGGVAAELKCPPTSDVFTIETWTTPSLWDELADSFSDAGGCLGSIFNFAGEKALGAVLPEGCAGVAVSHLRDIVNDARSQGFDKWRRTLSVDTVISSPYWQSTDALKDLGTCANDIVPLGKIYDAVTDVMDTISDIESLEATFSDCADLLGPEDDMTLPVACVDSFDPNLKVGPEGAGEGRFLSGEVPLRYAVFFENKETATSPANEVLVLDQLDPSKLDLGSFWFGPLTIGGRSIDLPPELGHFNLDVDLRPERNVLLRIQAGLDLITGAVSWRFISIDPDTGKPPEDPFLGFLPPNVSPPEGEGSVTYAVRPKKALPTGTEIRNQAEITFDLNAPIETPEWVNTIDNERPESQVLPLAAEQTSFTFEVRWRGSDAGSGVRDYTIYVSEEGGPYSAWLASTTASSAVFTGQPGKLYAFYSRARDWTGARETAPDVPDAETRTLPEGPSFMRGDCNGDGRVTGTVTDAVFLLSFNFIGGAEPPCAAACDANGDGKFIGQVTDAIYVLTFNFLGGPAPPQPFPGCGAGTEQDARLGCLAPPGACGG